MAINTKTLTPLIIALIILGIGFLWPGKEPSEQIAPLIQDATSSGILVIEVVDGDTINLEDGTTVRLLGIDTPETKDPRRPVGCFGKEASLEVKNLLEGKKVILEKDISETDKYERLLRYVYLPIGDDQKLFVNDYLVRKGFATVLTYPPDVKYNEQLRQAETQAREEKRGLWERC
ncbi:hypothetical protein A3C59_04025 [Candidatus Daviesbacteria bacterium RIFCSPHIGHO2_02_FULL_36_13]|uniref:TNase-like domain-containing protein n=1 Tax=Candidatus Daviesbacteria bacterium RIFCSPHIGHO2_02_FULL_36_13 TaxID=1797768 RepID=A0A1F5JR87_9BACT|nr:MAG: hypothetical protein A3C59_04025 [Candidatus Daviesbacteria bacterium RIFCSPHIGHO2_02_FULL_36_13]OGE41600.1 MAG: hypothetical protein A3A45_03400 [Candidatus Daviesbacteria bacterium RIFCSPLOWO2_01_FULL_36_8]